MLENESLWLTPVLGFLAGLVNVVIGSGSLITFPALVALGVPPVQANASNTIGLLPGSISGVIGYRKDLVRTGRSALFLVTLSLAGGAVGAVLVLVLPHSVFEALVPALIVFSCLLVALGPVIRRYRRARPPGDFRLLLPLSVFLTGIYGGYFGAAQGVILLAVLSVVLQSTLTQINGLKNLLAAGANLTGSLAFALLADVNWRIVGLLALGSVIGGVSGAVVGKRIPDAYYRILVVLVGIVSLIVYLGSRS